MSFNNGGHHLDVLLTAQTVRVQAASMGGYTICFCCCSPYYPLYLPIKSKFQVAFHETFAKTQLMSDFSLLR